MKLADFGLARYVPKFKDANTQRGLREIAGTYGYMAPEVAAG